MQLTGTYAFPNHPDLEFVNPNVDISPEVLIKDPDSLEIYVHITIPVDGMVRGSYYIDINPVPVFNLTYDTGDLVDRIMDRVVDFKQD
jgi:hypothetical protein